MVKGRRIDTVPLHKERILKALHISEKITPIKDEVPFNNEKDYSEGDIRAELFHGNIGLIEVLPREIVKKYGFMTGTQGNDDEVITITCYEVANKVPRTFILDELMYHLVKIKGNFTRKRLEGIGVLGCIDGFNPYWVYEKYGFKRTEKLGENTFVLETSVQI